MRQLLNGLRRSLRQITKLASKQNEIDPLVFHNKQHGQPQPENLQVKSFRQLFSHPARESVALRLLRASGIPATTLRTQWADPVIKGVYQFKLVAEADAGSIPRDLMLQIFGGRRIVLLEQEQYLFSYVDRDRIGAPAVVAQGSEGIFRLQILAVDSDTRPSRQEWLSAVPGFLGSVWSLEPPRRFVRAYASARMRLPERLNGALIERARIAVASAHERAILERLLKGLPKLRARLETLPVVVHNPYLRQQNAVILGDGTLQLINWGAWTLEPIGYGIPSAFSEDDREQILVNLRGRCAKRAVALTITDLRLVQLCQTLESLILRESFGEFFVLAEEILSSTTSRFSSLRETPSPQGQGNGSERPVAR